MGIAHNKNYFEWFEIGRTEYCRRKRIPYDIIESRGFFLVVVESFCRYKKALHYDQKFVIRVTLRDITVKKVIFDYEILIGKDRQVAASGYTIHIATDKNARVTQLTQDIIDRMRG